MAKRYLSAAETAKLVRAELKEAFPKFKGFSVTSKTYSGGASINVSWTDGPTAPMVDAIVKKFAGSTFDGMVDLKTHHDSLYKGEVVSFGADYVFTNRKESVEFMKMVMARGLTKFGAEQLEDARIALRETNGHTYIESGYGHGIAYWFNRMRQNMLPNGVVVELKA